ARSPSLRAVTTRPARAAARRLLLHVLVHPLEGLRHGLLPVAVEALALAGLHRRAPALVLGPVVDDVLLALPEPDRDARGVRGTERRGLRDLRPHDVHAELVRLELHEQLVGDHAAVDAELGEVDARVR